MRTTGSSSSGGSDGDGDADPWSAVNLNLEGDDVTRFFEQLAKETNRDPEATKQYLLQAIDARQKEDWSGAIYNYTMATTTRQGDPDKAAAPLNDGGSGSVDGDDDLVIPAKMKAVQGRTAVFSAWLEGIQQDKRQAEIEAKFGAREADLRTIMLRFKVRTSGTPDQSWFAPLVPSLDRRCLTHSFILLFGLCMRCSSVGAGEFAAARHSLHVG
jgi:hypothetical protein